MLASRDLDDFTHRDGLILSRRSNQRLCRVNQALGGSVSQAAPSCTSAHCAYQCGCTGSEARRRLYPSLFSLSPLFFYIAFHSRPFSPPCLSAFVRHTHTHIRTHSHSEFIIMPGTSDCSVLGSHSCSAMTTADPPIIWGEILTTI